MIISIVTSSGIAVANHLEESIIIHLYQVSKIDQLDENDIRKISNETVHNWEQIIREGEELSETKVDIANTESEIDNNNPVEA